MANNTTPGQVAYEAYGEAMGWTYGDDSCEKCGGEGTFEAQQRIARERKQPAPDLDKLGTFTFTVSTWEESRYRTQFIDNSFGRYSVKVYDNGKPMLVSINVEIFPSDEMLPALDRLVAAIEKAGFILDQPKGRGR